jgi:hypothetical protein
VIATPDHTALIEARLRHRELDLEHHRAAGRLAWFDASATLAKFMRNGMPDWREFRAVIGRVLEEVQAAAPRGTRAYGEMVNVLWREGQVEAAIRLEDQWNELAKEYAFALFCCYVLDGTSEIAYGHPLHEIGRTHSDVLPTDEDERLTKAVEAASKDIFGVSLPRTLSSSGHEDWDGEHRLPLGQRTLLWLRHNMPGSCSTVLRRARTYLETQS